MPGRIAIACAHGELERGTSVPGFAGLDEWSVSCEQSQIVAEELIRRGHQAQVFDTAGMARDDYLVAVPTYINENGPWDLAIQIHHNSAEFLPHQHGLAIYALESVRGLRAAQYVARELSDAMPWTSRPAAHVSYPRAAAFVLRVVPPALLIEPGFFRMAGKAAPGAAEWYSDPDRRKLEAEAIARGIHFFKEAQSGK